MIAGTRLLAVIGATVMLTVVAPVLRAAGPGEATKRYIVHFRAGHGAGAEHALRARAGTLRHRFARRDALGVEMTPAASAALAHDPAVRLVEPDAPRYPVSMRRARPSGADTTDATDPTNAQTIPWGVRMIGARRLKGDQGADTRVCVIDSGYDLGHEDKPGRARVSGADDFAGAGRWDRDDDGHGSHVSGTINARNNALGVVGVFPRARLFIVKVFDGNGD